MGRDEVGCIGMYWVGLGWNGMDCDVLGWIGIMKGHTDTLTH